MERELTFTICTPLYRRAASLPRLLQSLEAQSFRDFEWLIVEDGSDEETDRRVRALLFEHRPSFEVRVLRKKKHRGLHTAVNRAVDESRGSFFVVLRSDEELLPGSLSLLQRRWHSIPMSERPYFSSVAGLSQEPDGTIRGEKFPSSPFDSTYFESEGRYGIGGRSWGFQRTAVMKKQPYPEFAGERYCPEGLVLNRIGMRYLTRYVNEPLVTVHENELSKAADRAFPPLEMSLRGPAASALFFMEQLGLPIPLARKIRAALAYVRHALHTGKVPDEIYRNAPKKLLVFFALSPGYFLYRRDLAKRKKTAAEGEPL
jgi:glycosyltransferase involved in cell wall biosynthesis